MKTIAPFLCVLVSLWLAYCAGASHGAAFQRARDADAAAKAVHDSNEVWKAQFLARDTARDDSLRKLSAGIRGARGEIARLKARVGVAGRTGGSREPDSSATPPPDSALAIRDTIIAQQDSVIAGLDSSVTLYQAMLGDRDVRISQLERESAALRVSRDAWRKTAQPGALTRLGRGLPWLAAGALIWEIAR